MHLNWMHLEDFFLLVKTGAHCPTAPSTPSPAPVTPGCFQECHGSGILQGDAVEMQEIPK